MANGGDGRTDGQMDGRTDGRTDGCFEITPCVLQDIDPLGPLPKKERKKNERKKERKIYICS